MKTMASLRYYNPSTGRFISEDPLGLAGKELNLYNYTGNNPISFIDPSGQSKWHIYGWNVVRLTAAYLALKAAHKYFFSEIESETMEIFKIKTSRKQIGCGVFITESTRVRAIVPNFEAIRRNSKRREKIRALQLKQEKIEEEVEYLKNLLNGTSHDPSFV